METEFAGWEGFHVSITKDELHPVRISWEGFKDPRKIPFLPQAFVLGLIRLPPTGRRTLRGYMLPEKKGQWPLI